MLLGEYCHFHDNVGWAKICSVARRLTGRTSYKRPISCVGSIQYDAGAVAG